MGKGRYIYFNDEISELLSKEENKSALVNKLLKEHYEKIDVNMMSKEQLLIELEKEKIREEFRIKLKELENAHKEGNFKKA